MSSAASNETEVIPDRETCQKLVENFAEITGTDEACAQFYLQDRQWNLERSVNAYFESQKGGELIQIEEDGDVIDKTLKSTMKSIFKDATTEPPSKFRFITWNIDGLDPKNLKKRTKAVKRTIEINQPDIVFLQELIPETYSYLETNLPQYMAIPTNIGDYFNASFLLRTTTYFDRSQIIPFSNTNMGRSLLFVEAHIGNVKLRLFNTHLESTAPYASERVAQLKRCIELLSSGPSDSINILAGDLNLRDKEVLQANLPARVSDLWETCGSRKECQYTWDLRRNTNLQMPSKFQPRCRFDRVYFIPSKPSIVKPIHFGIIGIEKVTDTESFPSDHWGIMVDFQVKKMSKENISSTIASSSKQTSNVHVPPSLKSFLNNIINNKETNSSRSHKRKHSESNDDSIIILD